MSGTLRINSERYWDHRFTEDWEARQGPSQSRFFAQLAIEHMPSWLLDQIRCQSLTVVDWGCAQGDGTDVWAAYLDIRQLIGVDFSSVAVEQASRRYPGIRFMNEDWLNNQVNNHLSFDVVFSSNTLEHFQTPYDVLDVISKRAKKALILALPYREYDRIDEHFFSFLPENIPISLNNGFRLMWSKVVDCKYLEGGFWGGDQIILVYADPVWIDSFKLTLINCKVHHVDRSSDMTRLSKSVSERESQICSLKQAVEHLNGENLDFVKRLADRVGLIDALNAMLADRNGQIDTLNAMLSDRNGQIDTLNAMLSDRNGQVDTLNLMLSDRNGQVDTLNAILAERDEQIECINKMVVDRNSAIDDLKKTIAGLEGQINHFSQITLEQDNSKRQINDYVKMLDIIRNSLSWRITKPLRLVARIARHGLIDSDKQKGLQFLRSFYHRLPLASTTRHRISQVFKRRLRRPWVSLSSIGSETANVFSYNVHIAPYRSGCQDYIVWGVIDWHFRHQRPQQLAKAISDSGRRVFYISESMVDSDKAGFEIEALDNSGRLFNVKLLVKGAPVIYHTAPTDGHVKHLLKSIGKLILWAGSNEIISLVQHPFWMNAALSIPNSRTIYDCMDHHEGFGSVSSKMIEMEQALFSAADLTITTSAWLDEIVSDKSKNRIIIRNACEFEHFAHAPENIFRDAYGRKMIGYYGAIAEWFDIDLVGKIADRFPDCCIFLIGADTVGTKKRLSKYPNVVLTGEIHYNELPQYLHAFDVCILPFLVIPLTLATNPVKVYEYLSAGKPVVTVDLPEMTQFGSLVDIAQNHEQFLSAIEYRLLNKEDKNSAADRQAFARSQTWVHRAEMVIQHSEDTGRDPHVSVIILTYNNINLTKACLASIEAYSQYENIEIILVDNASSDDTPNYLADWVKKGRNRKLVQNKVNRGFAGGNNDGLAVATGEYLVLLNNDTYVTPGWIRTMVNHMRRNPDFGVLGPVTNNIGNEARIEITYGNMEDMLLESSKYTYLHMGKTFPLRTAAFFCVMMPRKVFESVGPLDEAFGRGFFEDDDYCRRVEQQGFKIVCTEDVFIHHHLSASFNKLTQKERNQIFEENKRIYEAKWGAWIPHDYRQ